MPQPTKNAPDAQDVYNMVSAIGEGFHMSVEFTKRYYADYVQVVARCYTIRGEDDGKVIHQALVKYRYGRQSDEQVMCYTLAFDLWCQLDGGGASAAQRGAPRDWQGRLEKPRRRG